VTRCRSTSSSFSPTELWGARAEDSPNSVYAELFEAYLQPIEENQ